MATNGVADFTTLNILGTVEDVGNLFLVKDTSGNEIFSIDYTGVVSTPNLVTSDPSVDGELYDNSGTVTTSAGA